MNSKTLEQRRKAYRTLDAALAHRNAFNMDTWASNAGIGRLITLTDLEQDVCGTTACYAGWHAALAGFEVEWGTGRLFRKGWALNRYVDSFTAEDLGLEPCEWNRMFFCDEDRIADVVAEIFGPRPDMGDEEQG